jgi:hypothetical protein
MAKENDSPITMESLAKLFTTVIGGQSNPIFAPPVLGNDDVGAAIASFRQTAIDLAVLPAK